MSKVKIKLNNNGVKQLLLSNEVMDTVGQIAHSVQSKCGEGYSVDTYRGKNRVNASVYAQTDEAQKDNYQNNTLLKAVSV